MSGCEGIKLGGTAGVENNMTLVPAMVLHCVGQEFFYGHRKLRFL